MCYLLVLSPPVVHSQWWRLFARKVEATVPPVATTETPTTAGTEPAVPTTTLGDILTTASASPEETTSSKPNTRKRPLKLWKNGEFVLKAEIG